MADLRIPETGVPREWISSANPQWANWIDQYADAAGVPRQFAYNILWQETGTAGAGLRNLGENSAGAAGVGQFISGTAQRYGVTNRMDPESSIRGAMNFLADLAWNRPGTLGNAVASPTNQVPTPERTSPDWGAAAGGFHGGASGWHWFTQGLPNNLGPVNRDYVIHTTQGVVNPWELNSRFIDVYRDFIPGGGYPPNDPRGVPYPPLGQGEVPVPVPRPIGSNTGIDPLDWHGDTGQEIGPRTGIPQSPGITLTGPSLEQWMATRGQEVQQFSHNAGYDLPAGVLEFVGRTAPELGGGPEAFPEGNFPWFTPGRIGEAAGAILQHHAFMPNNLVFDPEALTWRVPDPQRGDQQRFPGATGIWGAQRVADWLPTAGSGFETDYLRHLGYGAPPAGNLFSPQDFGASLGTLGMGNQGFGNIADMSTYNRQPFDYTQWFGALGTGGGATFDERFTGDPIAGIFPNNVPAGGFGYPGLPPPGTYSGPGYPGSAILPPRGTYNFNPSAEGAGLGYEGSYGLTDLPDNSLAYAIGENQLQNYYANIQNASSPMAIGVPVAYGHSGLDYNNAINASFNQQLVNAFNQQNQVFQQQNQATYPSPYLSPGVVRTGLEMF